MGNLKDCGISTSHDGLKGQVIEHRDEFFTWVHGFNADILGAVMAGDETGGLLYLFHKWCETRQKLQITEHDSNFLSELRPYILILIIEAVLLDPSKLDYIGTNVDGRPYSVPRPMRRIVMGNGEPYDANDDDENVGTLLACMPITIE